MAAPKTPIRRGGKEAVVAAAVERDDATSKALYAKGAIVRIRLENFVTYDSLEFRPGPNLNVVIGPNGTGKSTIVCAICLGMTGKPSVLGRASNICDFIKYGKNSGTIEIELNNTSGRNYVIRRVIYKDNRSDWFINDKAVKLKDVEDLVNDLNIQVGNLCQFLPQEKVAEFARMNPQELLENTEKAVGGLELHEKHIELKDRSKVSRDLERDLRLADEGLEKEQAINDRLENQVKSYMEKQKFEENIQWLKRKKACLIYKEKKDAYETVKKHKEKVCHELDELIKKFSPLENQKKELKDKIEKQKANLKAKGHQTYDLNKSSRDLQLKLDDCNEKINELVSDYKMKESEFKNHKNKLKELETGIEALRAEYDEAKNELGEIKKIEDSLKEKDATLRQDQQAIINKEFEIKQEIGKLKGEADECVRKINEMKNVREEKLLKLRERAKDVYAAIQWIEKNRQHFQGEVYEPMFLLMNIKDKNFSKYVENSIAFRDLTSLFLFENSNDMHHFMSEVRDKLNLIVHAALIPNKRSTDYAPPKSIQEIKKFGFQTYLREVIEAPEAILVYLCMYSNIHQVPVGNRDTQKNISAILPHIGEFTRVYTSSHSYQFTRSRYTNKVSSTSLEVPDSFWLNSSINQSQLGEMENAEKAIKQKMRELDEQLRSLADERQKVEKRIEANRNEFGKLREKRAHVDGIGKKLTSKQSLLESLQRQNVDLPGEASARLERTLELIGKKPKFFDTFAEAVHAVVSLEQDRVVSVYMETQLEHERQRLDVEMRTYNAQRSDLEQSVEGVNATLKEARDEAKLALDEASKINGISLERGVPESHKNVLKLDE